MRFLVVLALVAPVGTARAQQSAESDTAAFCSVLSARMNQDIAAYLVMESHRPTPRTERGESALRNMRLRIEEDVRRRADVLRLLDCRRAAP